MLNIPIAYPLLLDYQYVVLYVLRMIQKFAAVYIVYISFGRFSFWCMSWCKSEADFFFQCFGFCSSYKNNLYIFFWALLMCIDDGFCEIRFDCVRFNIQNKTRKYEFIYTFYQLHRFESCMSRYINTQKHFSQITYIEVYWACILSCILICWHETAIQWFENERNRIRISSICMSFQIFFGHLSYEAQTCFHIIIGHFPEDNCTTRLFGMWSRNIIRKDIGSGWLCSGLSSMYWTWVSCKFLCSTQIKRVCFRDSCWWFFVCFLVRVLTLQQLAQSLYRDFLNLQKRRLFPAVC